MSSIFLSHSTIDKTFARKLASDLRIYGHTIWIDEAEIKIGESLIKKIREGLDAVDYVAAILSNASIKSEWVDKELEIASNREIKEKKVIVLPLLIEKVNLPGFLEGKKYGDFTIEGQYQESLQSLLFSLGDSHQIKVNNINELDKLKAELEDLKQIANKHKSQLDKVYEYNLTTKTEKVRTDIERENKNHPEFAPINNVYAFEIGDITVTLGYLLHVIRKIRMKGAHIFEWTLEDADKWDEANRMLDAYIEMIKAKKRK